MRTRVIRRPSKTSQSSFSKMPPDHGHNPPTFFMPSPEKGIIEATSPVEQSALSLYSPRMPSGSFSPHSPIFDDINDRAKTFSLQKEMYPLLDFLCETDAETRDVFGDSVGGGQTLLAGEHEKIQQYTRAAIIGDACLNELILLIYKMLYVMPKKYDVMKQLGCLLNVLAPPTDRVSEFEEEYKIYLPSFKRMRQLKNKFIQSCIVESLQSEQEVDVIDTSLEKHYLPRKIQYLLSSREKANLYQNSCGVLITNRLTYLAILKAYSNFSKQLENKSITKRLSCFRKYIKEYQECFQLSPVKYEFADFKSGVLSSLEKSIEQPVELTERCLSQIKKNNAYFLELVTSELCAERKSLEGQYYQSLLKKYRQLIPCRSSDQRFFVSKQTQEYLMRTCQVEKRLSQAEKMASTIEEISQSIQKEQLKKIEDEMLEFFCQKLCNEQKMLGSGPAMFLSVKTQLVFHFNNQKSKMGYLEVLFPWKENALDNPYLQALELTRQTLPERAMGSPPLSSIISSSLSRTILQRPQELMFDTTLKKGELDESTKNSSPLSGHVGSGRLLKKKASKKNSLKIQLSKYHSAPPMDDDLDRMARRTSRAESIIRLSPSTVSHLSPLNVLSSLQSLDTQAQETPISNEPKTLLTPSVELPCQPITWAGSKPPGIPMLGIEEKRQDFRAEMLFFNPTHAELTLMYLEEQESRIVKSAAHATVMRQLQVYIDTCLLSETAMKDYIYLQSVQKHIVPLKIDRMKAIGVLLNLCTLYLACDAKSILPLKKHILKMLKKIDESILPDHDHYAKAISKKFPFFNVEKLKLAIDVDTLEKQLRIEEQIYELGACFCEKKLLDAVEVESFIYNAMRKQCPIPGVIEEEKVNKFFAKLSKQDKQDLINTKNIKKILCDDPQFFLELYQSNLERAIVRDQYLNAHALWSEQLPGRLTEKYLPNEELWQTTTTWLDALDIKPSVGLTARALYQMTHEKLVSINHDICRAWEHLRDTRDRIVLDTELFVECNPTLMQKTLLPKQYAKMDIRPWLREMSARYVQYSSSDTLNPSVNIHISDRHQPLFRLFIKKEQIVLLKVFFMIGEALSKREHSEFGKPLKKSSDNAEKKGVALQLAIEAWFEYNQQKRLLQLSKHTLLTLSQQVHILFQEWSLGEKKIHHALLTIQLHPLLKLDLFSDTVQRQLLGVLESDKQAREEFVQFALKTEGEQLQHDFSGSCQYFQDLSVSKAFTSNMELK